MITNVLLTRFFMKHSVVTNGFTPISIYGLTALRYLLHFFVLPFFFAFHTVS